MSGSIIGSIIGSMNFSNIMTNFNGGVGTPLFDDILSKIVTDGSSTNIKLISSDSKGVFYGNAFVLGQLLIQFSMKDTTNTNPNTDTDTEETDEQIIYFPYNYSTTPYTMFLNGFNQSDVTATQLINYNNSYFSYTTNQSSYLNFMVIGPLPTTTPTLPASIIMDVPYDVNAYDDNNGLIDGVKGAVAWDINPNGTITMKVTYEYDSNNKYRLTIYRPVESIICTVIGGGGGGGGGAAGKNHSNTGAGGGGGGGGGRYFTLTFDRNNNGISISNIEDGSKHIKFEKINCGAGGGGGVWGGIDGTNATDGGEGGYSSFEYTDSSTGSGTTQKIEAFGGKGGEGGKTYDYGYPTGGYGGAGGADANTVVNNIITDVNAIDTTLSTADLLDAYEAAITTHTDASSAAVADAATALLDLDNVDTIISTNLPSITNATTIVNAVNAVNANLYSYADLLVAYKTAITANTPASTSTDIANVATAAAALTWRIIDQIGIITADIGHNINNNSSSSNKAISGSGGSGGEGRASNFGQGGESATYNTSLTCGGGGGGGGGYSGSSNVTSGGSSDGGGHGGHSSKHGGVSAGSGTDATEFGGGGGGGGGGWAKDANGGETSGATGGYGKTGSIVFEVIFS